MAGRLLVLSSGFPNRDGSAPLAVFVRRQVERLAELFSEIAVIAPFPYNNRVTARWVHLPPSRLFGDYAEDNVRVFFPRYLDTPLRISHHRRSRVWLRLVRRCLRRHRIAYDLIYAHFSYPPGHVARQLAAADGRPYFLQVHENPAWFAEELRARDPKVMAAWRDADRIFTANPLAADALREHNPTATWLGAGYAEDCFVPGDRRAARRRLGLPADATVLLCVADYLELKNHRLLLAALRRLDRVDLVTCLVGRDRGMQRELERLIRRWQLEGTVRLIGPVPNRSLPDHYVAADLLVLPSSRESFGVTVLEALGCGTPVVATVNGGSEHLLTPECGELVADSEDDAEMAAAIERALARSWEPDRLVARARHFGMKRVARRVHEAYLELEGGEA